MRKYILTKNTREIGGIKLYQIRAIRPFGNIEVDDLGGWVEKEGNLSHEGNAWICDNAQVYGNAKVGGNALIFGDAVVCGNARIFGNARLSNFVKVSGNVQVFDNARVYGEGTYCGDEGICNSTWIYNSVNVNYCIEDGKVKIIEGSTVYSLDEFKETIRQRSKLIQDYLSFIFHIKDDRDESFNYI